MPSVPSPSERIASPWSPRARQRPLPAASRTPGAEALRGVGPPRVAAALGAGQPLAVRPPLSTAGRSPSPDLPAPLRWAAGQEGRVRPCPAGVHWRLPGASAPCPGPGEPPQAPERAGARGRACGGGSAPAMLRGPWAPAPAAALPLKALPALSPTELWPPGLGSPQLCPVTTTYYASLYPQTVPPAAVPGTCLDATPHGPEGQAVRCAPAGRLPVILGTPCASSPCAFRVWERREGRLGPRWSEAG